MNNEIDIELVEESQMKIASPEASLALMNNEIDIELVEDSDSSKDSPEANL